MMVEAKSGLIVNISSAGGLSYLFNVPYGVGKAGVDRMSQDTAVELKKHNVSVVTLWPGPVKTETCMEMVVGNTTWKLLKQMHVTNRERALKILSPYHMNPHF